MSIESGTSIELFRTSTAALLAFQSVCRSIERDDRSRWSGLNLFRQLNIHVGPAGEHQEIAFATLARMALPAVVIGCVWIENEGPSINFPACHVNILIGENPRVIPSDWHLYSASCCDQSNEFIGEYRINRRTCLDDMVSGTGSLGERMLESAQNHFPAFSGKFLR